MWGPGLRVSSRPSPPSAFGESYLVRRKIQRPEFMSLA